MGTVRRAEREAYRDAIGAAMACRRNDQEALEMLLRYQPALTSASASALLAMVCALMREVDDRGGDADATLRRWAMNLYEKQANE